MAKSVDVILMDNSKQILAKGISSQKTDDSIIATIVEVTQLGAQIRVGSGVMVKFLDNSTGINIFNGIVSAIKGSTVKIDGLKVVTKIQRRKDLKVQVRFDAQIYRMSDKATYSSNVRVVDISAGGVGFNSRENLSMEDRYYYLFNRNGRDISVKMKILRQKPIEGGFFYGCQFYDLPPTDEENIRQFVYKMQLLQNKLNQSK